MEIIFQQLRDFPFITLFLSLGLGFLLGKFKAGKFELGGIAGTLIVAVIIGQVGDIHLSESVKDIFFALFIFMVGYLGGPQFFSSLKPSSFKYLFAALSMTVLGLITVVGLAIWAGLDKGFAAGLAAGGLTQSAIIGTAGNAIDQLGLVASEAKQLKTNVAVGYSITYIFGSIGPILMIPIVAIFMKWDIRSEAIKLAKKMGGAKELAEGEFEPITRVATRTYKITKISELVNKNCGYFVNTLHTGLTVEVIIRGENRIEPDSNTIIEENDIVYVSGLTTDLLKVNTLIGEETSEQEHTADFTEEIRNVILTNKKYNNKTLAWIKGSIDIKETGGVYINEIKRATNPLAILDGTIIYKGDEISFIGRKKDLDRIEKLIGYKAPSLNATEFVTLGLGMVLGYLIGEISFEINSTPIALGSGLGCLISGLIVGYLRMQHPKLGGVNTGAANFLQTFGLAVFVGIVGLNAGAPALDAIKEHGVTLLLLGVVVTMIPMTVQFVLNYYFFKIKNPIEALGVLMGSKSANPGMAALLDSAGNATPTPTFTMTYAVANIFLTLWGPIIITLVP